MKGDSYTSKLRLGALHCPVREFCPLAFLCAKPFDGDRLLLPNIVTVGYREMFWTDLSARRQACVFDGDAVKDQINSLGVPAVPELLARLSMNQATCAHGQKLTLAH